MNVAAWTVSGVLALLYLWAGANKLVVPHERLVSPPQMAWAADLPSSAVKAIGLVEVLGAAGLILPWATGIIAVLTPLAAIGLAGLQIGAFATHARRDEYRYLPLNVALLAAAGFVALARYQHWG